jgi:N-acetylmuramoyl-L-alanine amidase
MKKSMKIAIDPGHGQDNKTIGKFDPGAVNIFTKNRECDIALVWGLTLKHVLTEYGIPCYMTRDDNTDSAPVGYRASRAREANCTHFISLHCNSTPFAHGTETFYRRSPQLAQMVQTAAMNAMGGRDRGIKTESKSQHTKLAVLNFPASALLEIGFISHANDLEKMLRKSVRISFATGFAEAIKRQQQ